jgi:hypothetical protein
MSKAMLSYTLYKSLLVPKSQHKCEQLIVYYVFFHMNSKLLHENQQGNIEAWELVSLFSQGP